MVNNQFKILVIISIFFSSSCAFDPPEHKLNRINKNYFINTGNKLNTIHPQILYSNDGRNFSVVASNCIDIYSDTNTIIFSSGEIFETDTSNLEYYKIVVNKSNSVLPISKANFLKEILGLTKVPTGVSKN